MGPYGDLSEVDWSKARIHSISLIPIERALCPEWRVWLVKDEA